MNKALVNDLICFNSSIKVYDKQEKKRDGEVNITRLLITFLRTLCICVSVSLDNVDLKNSLITRFSKLTVCLLKLLEDVNVSI